MIGKWAIALLFLTPLVLAAAPTASAASTCADEDLVVARPSACVDPDTPGAWACLHSTFFVGNGWVCGNTAWSIPVNCYFNAGIPTHCF